MRYLVTGGAGFIGSHLVARLLTLGSEVIVLDDLSTGTLENLREWVEDPRCAFVHGSVMDPALVGELLGRVDAVFHLAAVVGVQRVVERPSTTLRENVLGAENVLDAAARLGRPVLLASSSEVYGKNGETPLPEHAAVLPESMRAGRWAYGWSKLVAERHGMAHHRAGRLPFVVARLFNTVGPHQTGRYGMVLPRFVSQAVWGQDLMVHGDGLQSRCFCDVDDVVDALIGLLHSPDAVGEIFNVGSKERVTIGRLAARVVELTSSPSRVRLVPYEEVYGEGFEDVRSREPDTTKLRSLLGWRPSQDLDMTLRRLIGATTDALVASERV